MPPRADMPGPADECRHPSRAGPRPAQGIIDQTGWRPRFLSRLAPDGAAMAGLPEVIGLLYRADWTRLSLSAELRSETDREPPPGPLVPRLAGAEARRRPLPEARSAADRSWWPVAPGVPGSRPGRRGRGRRGKRRRARLVVAAAGSRRASAAPGQGGRRLSAAARVVLPVRPARRVRPGSAGAGDRRRPRRDRGRGYAAS